MKTGLRNGLIIGIIVALVVGFFVGYATYSYRLTKADTISNLSNLIASPNTVYKTNDQLSQPEQTADADFSTMLAQSVYNALKNYDGSQQTSYLSIPIARAVEDQYPDCGANDLIGDQSKNNLKDSINKKSTSPCEVIGYTLVVNGDKYPGTADHSDDYVVNVVTKGSITVNIYNPKDCTWTSTVTPYEKNLWIDKSGMVRDYPYPHGDKDSKGNGPCKFSFNLNQDPGALSNIGTALCPCQKTPDKNGNINIPGYGDVKVGKDLQKAVNGVIDFLHGKKKGQ